MLAKVTTLVFNTLLPLHCLVCRREGQILCQGCEQHLPRLTEPYCRMCADPNVRGLCHDCTTSPPHLAGIRAPYLMQGPVREAVHRLKYHNIRVAAPQLGNLMARYLRQHPLPVDLVAPVPLHPRRLRQRGYNQSSLLAREVAITLELPLLEGLLARTRDSEPQARLGRSQRVSNVAGAFTCSGSVRGRSVLLIDDVATTGSTLSACGEALYQGGAAAVWGLVLAREGTAAAHRSG